MSLLWKIEFVAVAVLWLYLQVSYVATEQVRCPTAQLPWITGTQQLPANGYHQQKEKLKAFLPLFYSRKATWCWPHNSWWAGELHNHQLNCSSWLHYIPWRWWAKVYSASFNSFCTLTQPTDPSHHSSHSIPLLSLQQCAQYNSLRWATSVLSCW